MDKEVLYEVSIKRSKSGNFIDGHYWWEVNVIIDGEKDWEYRDYGWGRSIKSSKKKALKTIYKSDKQITNNTVGIVFKTKGTLSDIEEALLQ